MNRVQSQPRAEPRPLCYWRASTQERKRVEEEEGGGRGEGREGGGGEKELEALRQQQGNFHNSRRFRWRRLLP